MIFTYDVDLQWWNGGVAAVMGSVLLWLSERAILRCRRVRVML
jgi:hypothetical protein